MSTAHDERMTKKIAQLTKVIIALNTRLEDFEKEKRELVDQYEDEIEQIVGDGRDRIAQLQEEVHASIPKAEHEAALADIQQQHQQAVAAVRERVEQQTSAIAEERDALAKREDDRQGQLLAMKQQLLSLTQDVRAKKARHHQQVLQLEKERAELEEKIKAQQTKTMESLHQRARVRESELQARINELEGHVERANHEREQEVVRLTSQHDTSMQQARQDWQRKLEEAASDAKNAEAVLRSELQVLKGKLEEAQQQLTTSADAGDALQSVRDELGAATKQLEEARERSRALEKDKAELSKELEATTQSWSEGKGKADQLKEELQKQQKIIQDLDEYSKSQEASLEASAGEVLRLQSLVKSLQSKASSSKTAATQHEERVSALRAEVDHYRQRLETLEKEAAQRTQALKTKHAQELRAAKEEQEAAVAAAKSAHARELQQLNVKLNDISARALQSEEGLRSQLSKASQQLEDMQERVREAEETAEAEVKARRAAQDQLAKLAEVKEELRSTTVRLHTTEAQVERLEDDLKGKKDEMSALREQHKRGLAAAAEEAKEQTEKELDCLRENKANELRRALAERDRQHSITLEHTRTELQREVAALKTQIEQLLQQLESTRQSGEQHSSSLQDMLTKLRADHDARVQELNTQHTNTVIELKREHEQRLKEETGRLETQHQQKLREVKAEHAQELDSMRSEQQALSNRLTQGAADEVEKAVAHATAKHETQMAEALQRLQDKHNRDLARQTEALGIRHEKELSRVRKEYEQELDLANSEQSALTATLHNTKAALEKEKTSAADISQELTKVRQDLAQTKSALEDKVQELLDIRRESNQTLQLQQQELQQQHEATMKEVVEKYRLQFARAGQQSTKIQGDMRQRILATEGALRKLQEEYDTRPSRPDDVERIQQLESRLEETQQKLKILAEENERLNLEVVNREHTFNLMFKNSPVVQPAPPKGQPKSRVRSGRSRTSASSIKL